MLQTLFKISLLGQIHEAIRPEQMYVDGHHRVSALASVSLKTSQNDPWLKHRSINFHVGCTAISHVKLISPYWDLKASCEVPTIWILQLYKTRKDIFSFFLKFLFNLYFMLESQEMRVLIPGSGKSPGGGNGNPLQYSCLENPMDRGAWQVTVHRITKSWT